MEAVAILAGLAFAGNKTVSVIKGATAKDWKFVFTQVLVWVVMFGVIVLAAHAQITEDLVVPALGIALGSVDFASQFMLAWILGSSGSVVWDFKKAIDQTDSAREPTLAIGSDSPTEG